MVDFAVVPERTALINVDMQNCFVHGSPIAAPEGLVILERVNRLAAACRKAGILVIHASIVVRRDGSNLGVLAEFSPPVREGILNKGSESAALHKGLIVDPHDILLEKPRFGAFHGTDLELILRKRGIDTVIISGVATNVCCETTAREAAVRDFHVFFLSDGTATAAMGDASAEELQKATCATLGFLFAQVLTVDEMIGKVQGSARSAAARD
ncbi:MAG TPA: isochorismatase family cysteine hydrolase [Candidatus Polarisedimenticolia bacterium]|nr:isochorismatase family cysteine hydrolase [Candidatus Polarisedimenticolia bacterium]